MNPESPVSDLPFVGSIYAKRLKKLGIKTIWDLIHHVPTRYLDYSLISPIKKIQVGETITIQGQIVSIKNHYTRTAKKIQIAQISDQTTSINAVWFNQPYLVQTLPVGTKLSLAGKVDWWGKRPALISPEYEKLKKGKALHTARLVPIYPTTAGVSSKWLRRRIADNLKVKNTFLEFLPKKILHQYNLLGFSQALKQVHFPKNLTRAKKARERLAFNELLFLQMVNNQQKLAWQKKQLTHRLEVDFAQVKNLIKSLNFDLTKSQERSLKEILTDLKKETPMNRLLEGDVGSGKTIIASIAAFVCFLNGCQTVLMAPTQILAQQHFHTLKQLFRDYKIRISLMTASDTKQELGRSDIFVGTHALIRRKINFDKVRLVIIDEQHKFGVEQQTYLIKKAITPHVLTMTATPIPRTIALTFYSDLNLSTLDELPKGRKPITTWIVPHQKRTKAYQWITKQIKTRKIQAFVICPLIEESTKETMQQVKAATVEFKSLKKVFPQFKLGLIHGKQKVKQKERQIQEFKKGRIDILVATPVVEVGIDIPNACLMIIEAAERFGLAQLHQLRGRIGRSNKKSYCLLFNQARSPKSQTRLEALTKTISGFELAELDLKLRGPGEIYGIQQHGFLELKIASWQDVTLIKKSKATAQQALQNPQKYKKLLQVYQNKKSATN